MKTTGNYILVQVGAGVSVLLLLRRAWLWLQAPAIWTEREGGQSGGHQEKSSKFYQVIQDVPVAIKNVLFEQLGQKSGNHFVYLFSKFLRENPGNFFLWIQLTRRRR
jgi:hypothetical protein